MGELKAVTDVTPRLAYLYLGVMVATWAANWPLMRLALAHAEPMVFVSLRMAGSIAILAPILAALSCPLLPVRRERLALFWVGQLQVTGFLVFSIIGLAIVPPGRNRRSSRGEGGIKKTKDQPHALALTIGKICPSGARYMGATAEEVSPTRTVRKRITALDFAEDDGWSGISGR